MNPVPEPTAEELYQMLYTDPLRVMFFLTKKDSHWSRWTCPDTARQIGLPRVIAQAYHRFTPLFELFFNDTRVPASVFQMCMRGVLKELAADPLKNHLLLSKESFDIYAKDADGLSFEDHILRSGDQDLIRDLQAGKDEIRVIDLC